LIQNKTLHHLPVITGLFVAVLLISNIASSKILLLGPFTFDGGTILFPLSYIFGDILTEVYGYARSRKVIWTGFVAALLMSLTFYLVGKLPAAADWNGQEAWNTILGATPRIVLASLLAYLAGEFSNSVVLAKMKVATEGRFLWARTIGSTLIGEGVDTSIFCLVAFYGVFPNELLFSIIVSNYIFKCAVEVALTPATYGIVQYLKRSEGEDYYDRETNFNPLRISSN
jgi:hypothetical protein